ncbi:MAG: redoxin domain-containing protein, partial [Pirellulales bacterium]|nr:redoxin domain-containing protein [Pirellulales bacterium]
MRGRRGWWISVGLVGTVLVAALFFPGGEAMSQNPFPQRLDVPALPEGMQWVNTDKPVRLADLHGKFVLVDFWTYCCINCMHCLPTLAKLEKTYPDSLVVIGVHSAKFKAEKDQDNLASAVRRLGIRHPVVNDADLVIWKRFKTSSWPTFWLIDPQGKAIWGKRGEASFDEINAVMKKAIPYYRRQGLLNEKPIQFMARPEPSPSQPLRFPGKVLADEASGRLFIADTGHHRLVVT